MGIARCRKSKKSLYFSAFFAACWEYILVSRAALQKTRKTIYVWVGVQAIAVAALSLVLSIFQGFSSAGSVLLGGIVYILPNLVFARRFFTYFNASHPEKIVKRFYLGELFKLLLTGLLFILTISFIPVKEFAFFIGFIAALFAFWLAPLLIR